MPCELLEFSSHGVLLHFSFSRMSSAVMPDANSFFSTASASAYFASSAAFCSALAFFSSILATFFSTDFSSDFLVFRLVFFSSISFWIASSLCGKSLDNGLLLRNLRCKVGFGAVLASFGSGHICAPPN